MRPADFPGGPAKLTTSKEPSAVGVARPSSSRGVPADRLHPGGPGPWTWAGRRRPLGRRSVVGRPPGTIENPGPATGRVLEQVGARLLGLNHHGVRGPVMSRRCTREFLSSSRLRQKRSFGSVGCGWWATSRSVRHVVGPRRPAPHRPRCPGTPDCPGSVVRGDRPGTEIFGPGRWDGSCAGDETPAREGISAARVVGVETLHRGCAGLARIARWGHDRDPDAGRRPRQRSGPQR